MGTTRTSQLHHRILGAIGLTPSLVGLSLVGCAPESIDAVGHPEPELGPEESGQPAPPAGPDDAQVEEAYSPVTEVFGVFAPGHVVEVQVHGVPAGSSVALYMDDPVESQAEEYAALAFAEPLFLGEAFAGSNGVATLRFLVPEGTTVGPADLQAAADDGLRSHFSGLARVEVVEVTPDVGAPELHPLMATEELVAGARFRACIPSDEYDGSCPAIEDFHAWQALEIVSYALDRPLPAEVSASACLPDTAFAGDCCYGVELWSTVDGSPADACVRPEPVGGGGGGGGGGWWDAGRPFVGPDGARYASVRRVEGWCADVAPGAGPADPALRDRVIRAWIRSARSEHASVASFGRFVLELLSVGAPADLVARATRAQADEIRHARDAFGVASAFAGEPIGPGDLPIDGALDRRSHEDMLVAAILEGCINETVSAVQVQEAARRCEDPVVAAMLAATAEDELRHAELSWAYVRWMLAEHPELAHVARRTFANFALGPVPEVDPDARALARWGVLSDRDLHLVAVDVLAKVVAPSARALLGASDAGAEATC